MRTQHFMGVQVTSMPNAGLCWLALVLGLSGCAQSPARSLARAWDDAPKLRWSRMPGDVSENKDDQSKVSANAPAEIADSKSNSANAKPKKVTEKSESAFFGLAGKSKSSVGPQDPFLEAEQNQPPQLVDKEKIKSRNQAAKELAKSNARDRLRASLSEEPRSPIIPVVSISEQEQARVRVESLMRRANLLCEKEEWTEAKRVAEFASRLAETARLEFDSEELRPIELVSLINSHIEHDQQAVAQAQPDGAVPHPPVEEKLSAADAKKSIKLKARQNSRSPYDDHATFDPYPEKAATGAHTAGQSKNNFGESIVVLETPSFDDVDEPAISPIGFSSNVERLRSVRQSVVPAVPSPGTTPDQPPVASPAVVAPTDTAPAVATPAVASPTPEAAVAPPPPVVTAPTGDGTATPPVAQTPDAAPPPAVIPAPAPAAPGLVTPGVEQPTGPALTPVNPAELPELGEINDEEASEETIRSASAWPRWMSYSTLSILIISFSVWYWRRHVRLTNS